MKISIFLFSSIFARPSRYRGSNRAENAIQEEIDLLDTPSDAYLEYLLALDAINNDFPSQVPINGRANNFNQPKNIGSSFNLPSNLDLFLEQNQEYFQKPSYQNQQFYNNFDSQNRQNRRYLNRLSDLDELFRDY
ncbi:Oidioi.mRNA.OKI2018_I69.chr2.g4550.t1.cds [Oikopleura dioica]|uniref:Oidioi.mRNA.OKI2018_I69.chr2.g4550.t1.cds n=1 Tax=Oikopleura dioica TaxID=34765 RepID=A0ABN7SX99_OIKDI|nr:Oidioi.mRNA.OKI2018_I69.chr2.g4550.t1.cds [Oikopleura dioica]